MTDLTVAIKARADVGEAPFWDSETHTLIWVDILGGTVHFSEVETGETLKTHTIGQEVGAAVPRITDGLVLAIRDGIARLTLSNGLAWSPDARLMYYTDSLTHVLWKSPWRLHVPGRASTFPTSFEAWVESWGGGWPVLFPSGGGPSSYKGAALHFHGEASILPWSCDALNVEGDSASVELSVRLVRSPFRLVRTVRVEAGSPTLIVQEVTSWHPDLVQVPPPGEPRQLLGYLSDFSSGWFAITNTELDLGIGLTWPASALPYAWIWQELHGSTGYPWYGNTYTMAIEPSSSVPNAGLAAVMEQTGTQRCLEPGEAAEIELRAVFYKGMESVRAISPDGTVHGRAAEGAPGRPRAAS